MRGMHLKGIDAQSRGSGGGIREGVTNPGQTGGIECCRGRLAILIGDRRGRNRGPAAILDADQFARLPWHMARPLAPGMGKLQGDGTFRMRPHRRYHPPQGCFMGVVIKAEIADGDPAFLGHGGSFDEDEPGAGKREIAEMDHVPVIGLTGRCRILAHWRDDDAIGEGQPAQGQRREQGSHLIFHPG